MSASRFLLRTSMLSRFARRAFATEVAISPAPRLEHYSPVEMGRSDIAAALAEKSKKPWTELSKDDKIASKFIYLSPRVRMSREHLVKTVV